MYGTPRYDVFLRAAGAATVRRAQEAWSEVIWLKRGGLWLPGPQ